MDILSDIGSFSLPAFWVPVAAWTTCAYALHWIVFVRGERRHPQIRYVAALGLMLSLPLGLIAGALGGGLMPPAPHLSAGDANRTTQRESRVETVPNDRDLGAKGVPGVAIDIPGTSRANGTITSPEDATSRHPDDPVFVGKDDIPAAIVGLVTLLAIPFVIVAFFRILWQLLNLAWLRRSLSYADVEACCVLDEVRRQVRVQRHVHLLIDTDGVSPMTFGTLQPVVVIPADLSRHKAALRTALLHELHHVRRNDYAVGLMMRLITLPFAWHPLVRRVRRRMEDARESLCDMLVLADGNVPVKRYVATLLRFARVAPESQFQPALAAPAGQLKRRITEMNKSTFLNSPRRTPVLLTAIALLLIPLIVTACSNPTTETRYAEIPVSDVELELPSLELQVDYLITEIKNIKREIAVLDSVALRAESPGQIIRSQERASRRTERDILSWRVTLLQEMLGERLRVREEARMREAVGLTARG